MGETHRPIAPFDASGAESLVRTALDGLGRAYPVQLVHVLDSDSDARLPRDMLPTFQGCYDWHSSVHAHWTLVRIARLFPSTQRADTLRATLARSFTPENLAAEERYFRAPGREAFERPYGLSWLLQLCAELDAWDDPDARTWRERLRPMEDLAATRLERSFAMLSHPVRSGVHGQSAFSLSLALDWARDTGREDLFSSYSSDAERFFAADQNTCFRFEPSGYDFLSPVLAAADTLRRIWAPDRFAVWLSAYLPALSTHPATALPAPVLPVDVQDGLLVHLAGLALSRAWMLEGIAAGLPYGDPRRVPLLESAAHHASAGIPFLSVPDYTASHWLGSYGAYLLTRRGLERR